MRYFIIALLAGTAATFYGYTEHARVGEIETDGKEVVGEIWQGEERSGRRGSRSYKFEVAYRVEGRPITKSFPVTKAFFETHVNGTVIAHNSEVRVKYLPEDPQQAIIIGGSSDSRWVLWPGLVAFGVGLFGTVGCVVWGFLSPKS